MFLIVWKHGRSSEILPAVTKQAKHFSNIFCNRLEKRVQLGIWIELDVQEMFKHGASFEVEPDFMIKKLRIWSVIMKWHQICFKLLQMKSQLFPYWSVRVKSEERSAVRLWSFNDISLLTKLPLRRASIHMCSKISLPCNWLPSSIKSLQSVLKIFQIARCILERPCRYQADFLTIEPALGYSEEWVQCNLCLQRLNPIYEII